LYAQEKDWQQGKIANHEGRHRCLDIDPRRRWQEKHPKYCVRHIEL
jgi:hypothetical protein